MVRTVQVRPVPVSQRRQALGLLFAQSAEAERQANIDETLRAVEAGELSLDGLLVAEQEGQPAGAGLVIIQADRTAFVWPPVVTDQTNATRVADAIMRAIWEQIQNAQAWIGQCLIEPDALSDRAVLERNGFHHFTDLLFLQRLLEEPISMPSARAVRSRPFDPDQDQQRMASLLERTYIGTQDCPELNGKRTGEEALASHRASGQLSPRLWRIFEYRGSDVGVLLMTEHADQRAWEVVYMGLIPEARGNGYGRVMLLEGLHAAQRAGVESVFLSVDCRNTYALAVYRALAFAEIARRTVYARFGLAADQGNHQHLMHKPPSSVAEGGGQNPLRNP